MFEDDIEDQEGFSLDFDNDDSESVLPQLGDSESHDENESHEGGENQKPAGVTQEQYETLVREMAELRGRAAALAEQRNQPAPTPEKPQDNSNLEAQLKSRLKSISQKMYDPDTADEGLSEFLQLNAQIAAAQANQIVSQNQGPSTQVVDLMIERFLDRKERSDDLYEKVSPLLEAELKKVDKAAVARMSREQLNEALDTLYKSKKADVLEAMYLAGKQRQADRKKQASAIAPRLGGGGGTAPANTDKAKKISDTQRSLAMAMGFKEEEIPDLFKDEGEDQW